MKTREELIASSKALLTDKKYRPLRIVIAALAVFYVLGAVICALIPAPRGPHAEIVQNLSFNIKSSLKNCAGPDDEVVGMQSPSPMAGSFINKLKGLKRPAAANTPRMHTIRMKYSLAPTPNTQGLKIQDISLQLPDAFHDNLEYELSCRSASDAGYIVFRKFSYKLHTQNYQEAPVNPLPADCLGADGEVVVKVSDYSDAEALADTLKSSVFRAVLWNPENQTADGAALDLFLPKTSYRPGERISFRAHAADPSSPGTLEIIRTGKSETLLKRIEGVQLKSQKVSPYSYRDGLDWPSAAEFDLPGNAPTGYYVALLKQNDKLTSFPFVVRPLAGNTAPIAVIAATNTWQAYNGWGKGSFYDNDIGDKCLATDYARLISTRRPTDQPYGLDPLDLKDHQFRAERPVAAWLESNPVGYAVYTDDDLNADPKLLDGHRIVLIPAHSEYWTKDMYDSLQRHVDRGGSVLSLGANVIYTRVAMRGGQIEKDENGLRYNLDGEFGGFWSAHLKRPPAALLGAEYDARDYATYAAYKVLQADNPVFAGTGLKDGDLFAADGSGHEIDVTTLASPANTVVLAKGVNPNGYGADMVLIGTPAGGKIFSVGSISFFYALAHDEKAGTVLNNAVKMMLESRPAASRE